MSDRDRERESEAELPGEVPPMPAWAPKLIVRAIVYVAIALFAYYMVKRLHEFLFTLFIAFFLSLALEPAVKWLHAHGWRRGLATFAVMFAFFLIAMVMVALMIPAVISQIQALIDTLPRWLSTLTANLQKWFNVDLSTTAVREELAKIDKNLASYAASLAGNLLGIGARVVAGIFKLLTVGLFTFYFVADGPRFRRAVCATLPQRKQKQVLNAWDVAIDKTGGYLYSRLLLAAISATASFILLSLLGIPFALPLAVWVGIVSQFVPTVGTYIAMVVPLAVALFTDPAKSVWLLIFFTGYQQVENYFISPRVTARTMELHPAIAFGSAIVGGTLYGPMGAFLALPVVATVQSAVLVLVVQRHEVVEDELTVEREPDVSQTEARSGRAAGDAWWRRKRRGG